MKYEISTNKDIKCLLFMTAKENIFIAGADINEIKDITDPQQGYEVGKKGHEIFNKIDSIQKLTQLLTFIPMSL